MKKQSLAYFINKYSLNGEIDSVKWNVSKDNNLIETSSRSDDKSVISFVNLKDSGGLDNAELWSIALSGSHGCRRNETRF